MDLSMASYLVLLPALLVLLSVFVRILWTPLIFKAYTGIVLFLVLLLLVVDMNAFQAWGFRLDASPLKYLSNPREAWASVSNLPVFSIILGFLLIFSGFLYLFCKFINAELAKPVSKSNRALQFGVLLLLLGFFIIPMRGGFQLAPLNQSSVYFSDNNFANQAAINAPWNFMHSLDHNTESKDNPFNYVEQKQARLLVDSLLVKGTAASNIFRPGSSAKPNVIFIVWESFTEKATHLLRDNIPVTPMFNELKKEGIYFSNIYAAGDRTDKGIVAVLSGYPSQPTTSIVKTPLKASKLPMISRQLASNGYSTSFFYGGELEFANMKAYLLGGNFKKFTSKDDFDSKDQNSKWGAHDGVVMKTVIEGLKKETTPFFCTWLTLSSHEPFEVPTAPVIKGSDNESLFLNSLHYTDQVVYDFIQQCKAQPWWNNTLVVITADHGHRMPATGRRIDDFKMPILFLGGILDQRNIINDQVGSQVDIPATVLGQLRLPATDFTWSKSLVDSSIRPWAYFCFNNGYGFVLPGSYFIFDNVGKKPIESAGNPTPTDILKGKAVQQLTFGDYLAK
jgi:phosphoglycerol transferase MdoB-like AlkP superfamily enzyme